MLLGVTQHPAGRGDVKNNLLPAASSAARHAQAARLAHLETFVKAHLLSDNVTDTQGCRRLSLLAGLEDSGPVSLAEIIIKKKMWKLRAITSVFNVSKKADEARLLTVSPVPRTITSYSSSMLYALPLPSRPLFASRNEGY